MICDVCYFPDCRCVQKCPHCQRPVSRAPEAVQCVHGYRVEPETWAQTCERILQKCEEAYKAS